MGCICSKRTRAKAYTASTGDEPAKSDGTSAEKPRQALVHEVTANSSNISNLPRQRLDPKDFRFIGCKREVKVKLPGTINGQSFKVDDCEDCDIYILDYCAQVTIDDSKRCRIFIGPTDGSVFIRNCSDCHLAVVCRQLRTRDCVDCKVSLHCRTKPIVESSARLGFSCFDLPYTGLAEHMRLANLGPFHNYWSDVYDFTPKEGNWYFLPPDTTAASLLEPVPQEVSELVVAEPQTEEAAAQTPVLKSLGGASGQQPSLFVAFPSVKHEQAMQLARTAAAKGWLLRSNEVKLSAAAAGALAADAGWSKAAGKDLTVTQGTAGCVGLELGVPSEEAEAVATQVNELGGHSSGSVAAAKSFRFMGLDG